MPPKAVDPRSEVGTVMWRADCDKLTEYSVLCEMPLADQYYVQNDCQHNQYLAACNRVACEWPVPHQDAIEGVHKVLRYLTDRMARYSPVPFEIWGAKYTGMKRQRYLRAVDSLYERPLTKKDSRIQAFVKLEKLTDPAKDPRMIQARGARFNVVLGNYLKSFEHDLYHLRGSRNSRYFPSGRLIVKGMNNAARAALIEKHWYSLKKPVQLSLDCSRFDGHVHLSSLKLEHKFYMTLMNHPKELQRLLAWQCNNVCFTKSGLVYKVEGRRMSGDMNTALGNCVLMVLMMAYAMDRLGLKPTDWRMADDGDDCCIMVEEEHSELVQNGLRDIFLELGHNLKVEGVARELERVTLCSGRPIRIGGVRTMILHPARAIGKSRVGIKTRDPKFLRDYVHTVGVCQLALYSGVPVLQAHALALKRASNKMLRDVPGAYLYRLAFMERPDLVGATPVTDEARLDFAVAFGIDVESQIEIEHWYDEVSSAQILGLAPPHKCKEVPVYKFL